MTFQYLHLPFFHDLFQADLIPTDWNGIPIAIIQPDRDVATMGTGFTTVTETCLVSVYEYGKAKGREFLHTYNGY